MGGKRKEGRRVARYAALVLGGGCLSRAWLLEKQSEKRKEGGEPPPRRWAKVAKSQKRRGREEYLPSPSPPTRVREK